MKRTCMRIAALAVAGSAGRTCVSFVPSEYETEAAARRSVVGELNEIALAVNLETVLPRR
jgi:hypothetical protein